MFRQPGDQPEKQIQTRNVSKKVMAACPMLVLASIFAVSHTGSYQFSTPSATPSQDSQILAYVPYVKATNRILRSASAKSGEVLSLAKKWDAANQTGQLTPLSPVSFEDTIEDGARGDIFRAKAALVDKLLTNADQKMQRDHAGAVDETLLAMRLTESLKYCYFRSVFNASVEEEREISLLRNNENSFDTATKQRIHAAISQVNANTQDLKALTRASRIQYSDYVSRLNKEPVTIEEVHRTVLVTRRITSDPKAHDMMRYIANALIQTPTDSGPEYLSDLRLAWAAESANHDLLKKTLSEI